MQPVVILAIVVILLTVALVANIVAGVRYREELKRLREKIKQSIQ